MWRRRSAALQVAWVLACPGPPRRYRRALELWLSVVFKGEQPNGNAANTLKRPNRFHIVIDIHWAGGGAAAEGPQEGGKWNGCQLVQVPGLTLDE